MNLARHHPSEGSNNSLVAAAQCSRQQTHELGLAISVGFGRDRLQLKGGAEDATADVRVSRRASRLGRMIQRA
jgi:hypothetical protein